MSSYCSTTLMMRQSPNILTAYGYGYSGFTGTGYYVPTGTAPFSSGSTAPYANATSYSGAPYKTYNSSASGYHPTHHHPTHGPYPFPSGTAGLKKRSSNTTSIASTGDPSAKGTAASTGFASAPSSFGTSGGYTYTAPKGIPSEYFYHHRKPKRNVSRSLVMLPSTEIRRRRRR